MLLDRNVFMISEGLTESLIATDIDGVRVQDIQLPFNHFYLAFGRNFGGSLPGPPNRMEGAYISSGGKHLNISIATERTDLAVAKYRHWPFSREPFFSVPLDLSNPEATFKELLDAAISSGDINVDESKGALPDEIHVPKDALSKELAERAIVTDARTRNEAMRGRLNADAMPAVKRALGLVVGTLAYLNAEPDDDPDALEPWPDDVPAGLLRAFRTAKTQTARDNAALQLRRAGFSRIRILGHRILRQRDLEAVGHGGELPPHWRRGHLRHQAHGVGLQLRKLKWIRPTIVRADLGEPRQGHIYEVDRPD